MARKLDPPTGGEASAAPIAGIPSLRLPYESDLVSSLVRVISVWTSASFQRSLVPHPAIPDHDDAIPALLSLAAGGPRRPSELAAALRISAPATSRLIERLASAGLVTRAPDARDARSSRVELTPLGSEAVDAIVHVGDQLADALLDAWTDRDRADLTRLMHRFADAVDSHAAASPSSRP